MPTYFVVTRQQSRQKSAPGVPPWTPLPARRGTGAAVCSRICSAAEAGTRSPRPSFGERGNALPETPMAFVQPCWWGKLELPAPDRERTGYSFPQQKSGLLDFRRELSASTAGRELSAGTAGCEGKLSLTKMQKSAIIANENHSQLKR